MFLMFQRYFTFLKCRQKTCLLYFCSKSIYYFSRHYFFFFFSTSQQPLQYPRLEIIVLVLLQLLQACGRKDNHQFIDRKYYFIFLIILRLQINRHGHRTPLRGEIYPKDPYNFNENIKRDGYGALTNVSIGNTMCLNHIIFINQKLKS